MEVTKWLKPSISVSRIGDSASVQAATRVNAKQALYGAFEVKHIFYATLYFLHSSFFVRLGIPFLRPNPHVLRPTRTGPVKAGRRSALAARSVVSRPRLDRPEHGGHAGTRDHDCISNRIGSGIRTCPRCGCRLATFGALPTPSTIYREIIMLNNHRFWGHASGPSSSSGKTRSSFHPLLARPCRSALPRERFSPLALKRQAPPATAPFVKPHESIYNKAAMPVPFAGQCR